MRDNRLTFAVFFVAFLILHSILILSIDFFPFIDVPNHLAEGTIFRYYNDETNRFNDFYTLHYVLYPNTFHLFFYSLPIFPTVEVANRALHLLLVITLPILILMIINQIKGNKWLAVASFVLVYSYNLTYGFTGNAIALNTILLILLFWLKDLEKTRRMNYMFVISLLLISVYFMHAMVAMFCILMCFVFIAWRFRKNILKMALNSAFLLPSGLLILYWWFYLQDNSEKTAIYDKEGLSISTHLTDYYLNEYLPRFVQRGRFVLADNFQLFEGMTGYVVAFFLSMIFIIPFCVLIYRLIRHKERIRTLVSQIDDKFVYILLFLGVTAGCYFFLPSTIPGQAPIYERFSTILLLALIFPASRIIKENSKYFSVAALLFALVHFGLWTQYFYEFDQENKHFSTLLPKEKDKMLTMLAYNPNYRGRPVCRHFQNYHIVWNKGITTTKIIDFRFGMIRRKQGLALPFQCEVDLKEDPGLMLNKADYVLTRGEIPVQHKKYFESFKRAADAGKWYILYKEEKLTVLKKSE